MHSMTTNNKMIDKVDSNIFCIEDRTFYFGSSIPNKNSLGIFERFKIQNIKKIPCTVNFKIDKRDNQTEDCEFYVARDTCVIPPHESTYIKVKFKPTIMT